MRVFLGGTVNGSTWREEVKEKLSIDYFDPVVDNWNEAAYEIELSERRYCDYLLYVITPKLTGYYAIAEVADDSFHRPDRTLFCYLKEDEDTQFTEKQIIELEELGRLVSKNGGVWLDNLDQVVTFLNSSTSKNLLANVDRFDVFVSYGRRESMGFTSKIVNRLSEKGFSVFFDRNEIPLIIENEDYIFRNILKSDNFVYIISPNSIRSEYCKKELEFAIKYNKRIIPIVHNELGFQSSLLDNIVQRKKQILFTKYKDNFEDFVNVIIDTIEKDKYYVQKHSQYLFESREWDFKGRKQTDLLYGKRYREAKEWSSMSSDQLLPLQIQLDFINQSSKLSVFTLPLLWLHEKTKPITNYSLFDKVTLAISLANPLALFSQLFDLLSSQDDSRFSSISVLMWTLFLIIQLTLTFVGIKNKDQALFLSMLLSSFISISVLFLVFINR